jgi:hypothetical protein
LLLTRGPQLETLQETVKQRFLSSVVCLLKEIVPLPLTIAVAPYEKSQLLLIKYQTITITTFIRRELGLKENPKN